MNAFLEQFQNNPHDENIISEAISQFHRDEEARNDDLLAFIDDFISSEEYQLYLQSKKPIKKINVSTQLNFDDNLVQSEENIPKLYPYTNEARKIFEFNKQLEKFLKNKSNAKVLERQERGIKMIRDKMEEVRRLVGDKEKILQNKKKQEDQLLRDISKQFNINLTKLKIQAGRSRVAARYLCLKKAAYERKQRTQQNLVEIIKKLIKEYKRKMKIDAEKNKKYNVPVKVREKIIKDMEIVGTKIALLPRPHEDNFQHESNNDNKNSIDLVKKKKRKSKIARSVDDNDQDEEVEEQLKPLKRKKEVKEKKITKRLGSEKLVLPMVQIINKRRKIEAENLDNFLNLVEQFKELEEIIKNKSIDNMIVNEKEQYPLDNFFICIPEIILFQNYDAGKTYWKKINILNNSKSFKKCRMLKHYFEDELDEMCFEIIPTGIQKVASYTSFPFKLAFTPKLSSKAIEGWIQFLTYDSRITEYHQFKLYIKCIPKYIDLIITPTDVSFGGVYYWQLKRPENFKIIKFKNAGAKHCQLLINKLDDPLEIGEEVCMPIESPVMTSFTSSNESNLKEIEKEETKSYIISLLDDCIKNVFNNFEFQLSYFKLKGFEEKKLKIFAKNIENVAFYYEYFTVKVFEYSEDNSLNDDYKSQEIHVSVDAIDHFIKLQPETLYFGVCMFDSCYQLPVEVINKIGSAQAVSIKVPSTMKDYVKVNSYTVFVSGNDSNKAWIKFYPRRDICVEKISYFDKETFVIEFPIYLYPVSKNFVTIPAIKLTVNAILTHPDNIVLKPLLEEQRRDGVLDIGSCSIYEFISVELEVSNSTYLPQQYCFVNLPEFVIILPGYGFGTLEPLERKRLTMYFSPDEADIPKRNLEKFKTFSIINFKIAVETLANIGKLKKNFDYRKFRKSVALMMTELKKPSIPFKSDIEHCLLTIDNFLSEDVTGENDCIIYKAEKEINISLEEDFETESSEEGSCTHPNRSFFLVRAKIMKPFCDISHQFVEFPPTPNGSYSYMEIKLKALPDIAMYKLPPYEAKFTITSDSDEIQVQPTCGVLKNGEVVKLILIATPNVPEEMLRKSAKFLKYLKAYNDKHEELMNARLEKLELKNSKKSSRRKKFDEVTKQTNEENKKKSKNKRIKIDSNENFDDCIDVNINEDDISDDIDFINLFPAEMFYWRSLKPYEIKAKLICNIIYKSHFLEKELDTYYLNAICKVIKPNFITNLKLQRLNFGNCLIGAESTETISFQNINYNKIPLKFDQLNPIGPFRIPNMNVIEINPEHFLNVPITFAPITTGTFEEHIEIRSESTILSLILSGIGVTPAITIVPNFLVVRVDTKPNQLLQYPINVNNESNCPVSLTFQKVSEIEGVMKESVDKHGSRDSDQEYYTMHFTDNEKKCIFKNFQPTKDKYHFAILEQKDLTLKPGSTESVVIYFGKPELIAKERRKTEQKFSKSSSLSKKDAKRKLDKESKKTEMEDIDRKQHKNTHVVKYNILLGKTFYKDIIIIGNYL